MSKVYVLALIFPKPGKLEAVEAEIRKIIPTVRQEEGCIRYDLHRSKKEGAGLMFYEIWQSQEHLDAHSATPHLAQMRRSVEDLVTQPTKVTLWSAADVAS